MSYTFDAEIRTDLGKGASRRLRREDKIPAILYGAGKDPVSLTLDHKKIIVAQEDEGFYTHILTLNIGGEKVEALVKDMQRHPFKPKVTHIDFLRVDASQKLHTKVPVHFINEEVIAKQGNVVAHQATEVEITCLPKDLPEFIEVNVADLEVGQTLHLSDLKVPAGVSLVELTKGEDHDQAVVTINASKVAVEAAEGEGEEAAE
ncbi:50S ribosomal protein L25/general stress protein Ctc [Gallaecimonas sp. GXIMD4217]|uniref:50S ribosomal protein L25/general stress protein Ctc n=1 Tax=Gallaecimonas sp. GXIMD4217 TaxID=3131927 RepID=UPI00311ABF43